MIIQIKHAVTGWKSQVFPAYTMKPWRHVEEVDLRHSFLTSALDGGVVNFTGNTAALTGRGGGKKNSVPME